MFISPLEIIQNLDLKEGEKVADFGSGAGAYVFPIAGLVSETGKVYAIDNHEDILDKINREAKKNNLENIDTILANIEENIPLPDKEVDLILLSNVLSQVVDIDKVLLEVKRILRADGRILIIDWKNQKLSVSIGRGGFLEEEKLVAILAKHNLEVDKHISAGDYHYAFLAKKG